MNTLDDQEIRRDEAFVKRNPLRQLALYVTSALFLLTWLEGILKLGTFGRLEIPVQCVLGLTTLAIIWIVFLMKRQIWMLLFAFFLIAWALGYVWASGMGTSLTFTFLGLNPAAVILFGMHVGYNQAAFQELFRSFRDSDEVVQEAFEKRVGEFVAKYEKRSREELENLVKQGLVPEAEEAIRRISERESV